MKKLSRPMFAESRTAYCQSCAKRYEVPRNVDIAAMRSILSGMVCTVCSSTRFSLTAPPDNELPLNARKMWS